MMEIRDRAHKENFARGAEADAHIYIGINYKNNEKAEHDERKGLLRYTQAAARISIYLRSPAALSGYYFFFFLTFP